MWGYLSVLRADPLDSKPLCAFTVATAGMFVRVCTVEGVRNMPSL